MVGFQSRLRGVYGERGSAQVVGPLTQPQDLELLLLQPLVADCLETGRWHAANQSRILHCDHGFVLVPPSHIPPINLKSTYSTIFK